MGAPGKRSRVPPPGSPPPRQAPRSCRAPPIPLGLDTRKAGIGKWHLFLFLWLLFGGERAGAGQGIVVGRGQPPRLGLGEGNGLFWPSQQPPCETGQGTRPAILCAPLKSGNILLPASPPPLTLPERLRLGLAAQRVLSWGCGGREGTGPGVGWQSRSSQVRQEFLAAPHVSHASFHFPSPPPAVGGPSRPPGSTITCPSAPCHLLKISPTRSGSFSVLMSVYPMLTLTAPPKKITEKTGVNWGAEWPSWASSPSVMF